MAKTTNIAQDSAATTLDHFAVPDKTDLGWVPAEHVFVQAEPNEAIGDYFPGEPVNADEAAAIEFGLADVQAINLLADIDAADDTDVDLNSLLESVAMSLDLGPVVADTGQLGNSQSASQEKLAQLLQETEVTSDLSLQASFGFGELTVIIDDDGSDTVAL